MKAFFSRETDDYSKANFECSETKFDLQLWEAKLPRTSDEFLKYHSYDIDTQGNIF
jgi:hypothetical protein